MQNTMDVLDGFGREGFSDSVSFMTGIVELLDVLSCEGFQFDGSQTRLDVILDGCFIGTDGGQLHRTEIFGLPGVHPLRDGGLMRCNISTGIQGRCCLFQLLCHFALGVSRDRFLDLFTGAGIVTYGIPGFPVGVVLSVFCYGFLSDVAATCGIFLAAWHNTYAPF